MTDLTNEFAMLPSTKRMFVTMKFPCQINYCDFQKLSRE